MEIVLVVNKKTLLKEMREGEQSDTVPYQSYLSNKIGETLRRNEHFETT